MPMSGCTEERIHAALSYVKTLRLTGMDLSLVDWLLAVGLLDIRGLLFYSHTLFVQTTQNQ